MIRGSYKGRGMSDGTRATNKRRHRKTLQLAIVALLWLSAFDKAARANISTLAFPGSLVAMPPD